MDRIGELLGVPRIDNQAAIQALYSSSEFGQYHDSMTLLLASNVLIRNQVHTITRIRDEVDIGYSVQSDEFLKGNRFMHKVNRHKLDGA